MDVSGRGRSRFLLGLLITLIAALLVAPLSGSVAATATPAGTAGESQKPKPKKKPVPYIKKLIAAAKKEGTLTWYTAIPLATSQPVADAFAKKHGVKVEVFNTSSGPMAERYASERAADTVNADVINVADPVFFNDGTAQGWFVTLTKKNLPALSIWPQRALKLRTYAMIGAQPIGIAYNKNLVSQPPASWEDLLAPRFQGRILMTDPTLVPAWMATYKLWRDRMPAGFLNRLAAQRPAFVSSSNPGAQQVAAGEKWLNFPTSATALVALQERGAPIGFVIPNITTGVEMHMAVSTAAKHPNAARLFMNFALSRQAQALFNRGVGASVLPNIPGTLRLPDRYYPPDIAGAQRIRADLLAPFGR